MPNFVKFQRGSVAAYNALVSKDQDTLYFVYDPTNLSAGGLLYLGTILIGGTGSVSSSVALSNLTDVDLTDIADGALLQYDLPADKWIAVMPEDIGATGGGGGSVAVNVGTLTEGETVAHAQGRLNASPNEGDIVIISGEPYVYDGSNWQSLASSDIASRVSLLETEIGNLSSGLTSLATEVGELSSGVTTLQAQWESVDGKIATAISSANHLTYSVVGSLSDVDTAITSGGPDLNRTVFLVPNGGTTGNFYDEYMVINRNNENVKELLGNFGTPDLSNYVTTSGLTSTLTNYITTSEFSSAVGELTSSVNDLSSTVSGLASNMSNYLTVARFEDEVGDISAVRTYTGNSSGTLVEDVVAIYEMLEWHELNN